MVEAYDDFPDYVPNMGAWGESKPGDTPGERHRERERERGRKGEVRLWSWPVVYCEVTGSYQNEWFPYAFDLQVQTRFPRFLKRRNGEERRAKTSLGCLGSHM